MKDLGYEVTKLRDSNATYRDNLLWRIVMHYGEMPRATLGSSDLRSQVAIFGEWNIYGTRKKSFVKFQTSNAYLKKPFSWQKAEKGVKWPSITGSHLWRMKDLRYGRGPHVCPCRKFVRHLCLRLLRLRKFVTSSFQIESVPQIETNDFQTCLQKIRFKHVNIK
jgi:hypothetical protein